MEENCIVALRGRSVFCGITPPSFTAATLGKDKNPFRELNEIILRQIYSALRKFLYTIFYCYIKVVIWSSKQKTAIA